MKKTAEIITIGDEILIGQTIDTNSAYIGEKLSSLGFEIRQISSIQDKETEIVRALNEAVERAGLVIITGGLGPTKDDKTKGTLCRYFGGRLVRDEQVLEDIKVLLKNRKVPLNELNLAQAEVPDNCRIIRNPLGTAPGMMFELMNNLIFSIPGVPYEMKGMIDSEISELLLEKFDHQDIIHRMVMTAGYPESYLASLISDWEDSLPSFISLAYLPSPGIVKLRLSAKGESKGIMLAALDKKIDELTCIIPKVIFSTENISLEECVGEELVKRGLTISTAESCTGGNIAALLTSVAGSSRYFKGSTIAYDNYVKRDILGVPQKVLLKDGAVSRKTVALMALNQRLLFKTDLAVAVSGIAGPDGGTEDKPVGTVWIGVAGPKGINSKRFLFGNKRDVNIQRSSMAALKMVLDYLEP